MAVHRRNSSRLKGWLITGLLLVSAAGWLRPRLRQAATLRGELELNSVDDSALREAAEGRPLSAEAVERYWKTGRLPHRRAAINALVQRRSDERELNALWLKLLPEAALDPDVEIRTRLLGGLKSIDGPEALAAVTVQLTDVDPELRRLGLQTLRRLGGLNLVPQVLPLLSDRDPTVALTADATLRKWSGRDSGLRLSRLLPAQSSWLAAPVPADDLAAIRQSAEGWRDWWLAQPKPAASMMAATAIQSPLGLLCPEIQLPDLHGQPVEVGSLRGKRVLLNFWTTWCPACLLEIPLLNELQRRHPDDLVVLGISLDSGEQGVLTEGAGNSSSPSGAEIRKIVAVVAGRQHMNYRVLLDPENRIGRRFNGGELPTNVLLDRNGLVRRRFIGERSVEVWEDFLRDADRAPGS